MKKNAFTVSEFIFGLAAVGILTVSLFPEIYQRETYIEPPANCQSNLKQISLGILQYVQDYDERFPLVNSGKDGWTDIVYPYIKSRKLFQCPKDSKGEVVETTDYFYNARLSRQNQYELKYLSGTITIGDGASNSLNNLSVTQLPKGWTLNDKSPALRHLNSESGAYSEDEEHKNGANYGFADGHVKWLNPERITTASPNASKFTFTPS